MKKIYMLSILLISTFSGCEEYLDIKPMDFLSPENYYNTEEEANAALIGVYAPLAQRNFYGGIWTTRGHTSDESFSTVSAIVGGPWDNNITASDAFAVTPLWRLCYQGIERANILIENLDKVQMEEEKKSVIKGQALFLRGYYYFVLTTLWGDVPLKVTPTTSVQDLRYPKTPKNEIYTQILKDMTEAEGLVLTATEYGFGGRISKSTVQGILARVCLTMAGEPLNDKSQLQAAKDWALKVVNSGEHRLNPDFTNIFINLAADKYDVKECIWESEQWGSNSLIVGNQASWLGALDGIPGGSVAFGFSYGQVNITRKLFDLYDATDLRRDWTIAPFTYTNGGASKSFWGPTQIYERKMGKFRREYEVYTPRNIQFTPVNTPILRYADVLLMLAEAENELNGPVNAYQYINQVRRRAYGKLLPGATNPEEADLQAGLDQGNFFKAIQDERARELAGEGIRKFDLIRWGIYVSSIKEVAADIATTAPASLQFALNLSKNTTERNVLWPIPAAEFNLNPAMTQNTGW